MTPSRCADWQTRVEKTDLEARISEAAGRTPVKPMTHLRAKP
jgi:hypothetical protein